ncbi:hypothetical protein T4B_10459 [Trichinella pseudospiralis]|uniref:Uncharacterized protein n=1 Tax=Trichinella pseudospiralis TaxID=6337 RepID=A0A0V1EZR9_TRIPS|nr:hypothetical protein T4A_1019 [Trichinella pseudospiralis]KRZ33815.1 hypothetical protein T4B_10459 [Trichinella pseudospiralis]KRZ45549.1 hypothetical protein T4C_4318 [Trichinella pseudospiralis]
MYANSVITILGIVKKCLLLQSLFKIVITIHDYINIHRAVVTRAINKQKYLQRNDPLIFSIVE